MSALLGTTGNSEDYKVYLEEIGAVMDSTDDVYAHRFTVRSQIWIMQIWLMSGCMQIFLITAMI